MRYKSFVLERLEERGLCSVVAPLAGAAIPAATAAMHATPQVTATTTNPLAGPFNVAGTFTHPIGPIGFGNPDAGSTWNFSGLGKTKLLGLFTVTGYVKGPGFIASARASGRLVLSNASGTITLYLHGPPQEPGTLPPIMSYTIGRGTGAYANASGKGTFLISASSNTFKFLFRFNQLP